MKRIPLLLLALLLFGCGGGDPVELTVVVNAGAADWLAAAAATFNDHDIRTADNQPIAVNVQMFEAGDAAVAIANGAVVPDLWIVEDDVWIDVAQEQGVSGYEDCVSVANSPLVLGVWREVAELLGWPGRDLGWLDIGSLAADPTAWAYYSGGQFGETLRLGHTHPGLSASGASTLLALVQAAESKQTAVTAEDIQQPIVAASVGAFEGGVSWFAGDTESLAETMVARGPAFLGAAVMYENNVLADGVGRLVPVYPFEGTFVAEHAACIGGDQTKAAAAAIFRDWLRATEGQDLAVVYGLRPTLAGVDTSSLEQFAGVDLSQPEVSYAPPSVDTIFAVQELWQSARKPLHLAMLLDTSGSMRGAKIDNMLDAAQQFVLQMGENDRLSLVEFYTEPQVLIEYGRVGDSRDEMINAIQEMVAGGDTALFDAVGVSAELLATHDSTETANAMVVLTDGQDTSSFRFPFGPQLFELASANGTTVFTIAYGRDADDESLARLANEANGQFFLGTEANIGEIYQEMSAAFGGSAGIGR